MATGCKLLAESFLIGKIPPLGHAGDIVDVLPPSTPDSFRAPVMGGDQQSPSEATFLVEKYMTVDICSTFRTTWPLVVKSRGRLAGR